MNIVTVLGEDTALITNRAKIGPHEIYNLESAGNSLSDFMPTYIPLRRAIALGIEAAPM